MAQKNELIIEQQLSKIELKLKNLGFAPKSKTKETFIWKDCGAELEVFRKDNHFHIDYKKAGIKYSRSPYILDSEECENLSTLELILRLILMGYKKESIVLENTYGVGRNSAYVDVLVNDKNGKPYFLIEVKRESEFEKAKEQLELNGGQPFGYFQQDQNAHFLILYTSSIEDMKQEGKTLKERLNVRNKIAAIRTSSLDKSRGNKKDIFSSWNKQYASSNILSLSSNPYETQKNQRTFADLRDILKDDGLKLINRIEMVLRKHGISDEANAFNKVFNLLICKIKDETDNNGRKSELQFQINYNEAKTNILEKLKDLYKSGVKEYLGMDINEKYFNPQQEFNLIEVYNQDTFEQNLQIIEDLVVVFQDFRFKQSQKQQFLGDLFENLLSKGVKQKEGQFFTPTPLAEFIITSLPIEGLFDEEFSSNKRTYSVPKAIDYASGSGHFLIELMEHVQNLLNNGAVDINKYDISKSKKDDFLEKSKNFKWAKNSIYGVELDYRLSKVGKVSSFLNGDGDSQFIHSNGLKLSTFSKTETPPEDNGREQFSILTANPPYSVDGFKNLLSKEDLEFLPITNSLLTVDSGKIELSFMERASFLLKENGVAGIILPVSILTNTDSASVETRKMLLMNFAISSVLYLGKNTFAATSTSTIALFMRKRKMNIVEQVKNEVKSNISSSEDLAINGITKPRKKFMEFFDITSGQVAEYEDLFCIFCLNKDVNTLIVEAPTDNKEEKEFLGYKFSNRKGSEGIEILEGQSGLKLLAPRVKSNFSLNLGESLLSFIGDKKQFTFSKQVVSQIKYNGPTLGSECSLMIGGTPSRKVQSYFGGGNVWVSVRELNGQVIMDSKERLTDAGVENSNVKLIKKGSVLMSFKLSIGKIAKAGVDLYTNEAIVGISSKDPSRLLNDYLYVYLSNFDFSKSGKGIIGNGNLNSESLALIPLEIPTMEEQLQVIKEYNDNQEKLRKLREQFLLIEEEMKKK